MVWWERLTQREKIIMVLGAAFLSVIVFYIFIFQPLNAAVQQAKNNNHNVHQNLSWMEHAAPRFQRLRAQGFSANTASVKSLLPLAERTLAQSKISRYVVSVQSTSSQQVQLVFKKVPFDALIAWEELLFHHFSISVKQFSAHSANQPGIVNARVILHVS